MSSYFVTSSDILWASLSLHASGREVSNHLETSFDILWDKIFSFFPWDCMVLVDYVLFPLKSWCDIQCIQNNFYLIFYTIYSPSFLILSTLSFIRNIARSFQPVYKNLKKLCMARLKPLQLLFCLHMSKSAIIQTATLNILKTFILNPNLIN